MDFTFQGALPKNQQAIAKKPADWLSRTFFYPIYHADDFPGVKSGNGMPMFSLFISDRIIAIIKKTFREQQGALFPQGMKNYAGNLKSELKVEEIVTDKIAGLQ